MTAAPPRPTRAELLAAVSRTVPDVIAPGLRILLCGINPGLYSGAVGHHFARPGNRFWRALADSGLTPQLLQPWEEGDLLAAGIGITNLVARTTATAAELAPAEFVAGRRLLERKVTRFAPAMVAVLGVGAYRTGFERPRAGLGPQPEPLGAARLWVLPNPSGLNAHYQRADLARLFAEMRSAARAGM